MTIYPASCANGATREFRLVGTRHLQSLRQALDAALASWAGDWLAHDGAPPALDLHLSTLPHTWAFESWEPDSLSWGDARVWLDNSPALRARLGEAIAGPSGATAIADRWLATLLERARRERDRALCVALAGSADARAVRAAGEAVPDAVRRPGSGAIRIACPAIGLDVVASLAAWRRHLARAAGTAAAPARQPLVAAAADGVVRLVATLGGAALDAPTALDLRRGDVLRLARSVDDGVDVTCEGTRICRADLGRLGERLGVRLRR